MYDQVYRYLDLPGQVCKIKKTQRLFIKKKIVCVCVIFVQQLVASRPCVCVCLCVCVCVFVLMVSFVWEAVIALDFFLFFSKNII